MNTPAPLRIGVLGCANIARAFVRDVAATAAVKVVAAASRDAAKAAAFAAEFGLARHHGSYEALLADTGIDAIYLPLPNSLHAEWAVKAAAAGKHVLCEKPLATSLAEARAMFAAARQHGVLLLEAYPWWFQPQTGDLVALLHGGAIGTVRLVQANFGFTLSRPDGNIRLAADLGGGALLDAGSYPLSLVRLVMGSAPQRVTAEARWAGSGVDMGLSGTLLWDDGRRAQIECSMDMAQHRHATIVGTQGVIETEYLNHTADAPGHPHHFLPSQMRLRRGTANTVPFETVRSATGSGFRFAAEAFARVVAAGDQRAIDDAAAASLDIAATLEALALSARRGAAVDLASL
ncbi:MAG: Gfo/Idh/MocA family oxidoreductase [Rubrivivax sp.]